MNAPTANDPALSSREEALIQLNKELWSHNLPADEQKELIKAFNKDFPRPSKSPAS